MSKRLSSGQRNTLFNYFKSPESNLERSKTNEKIPEKSPNFELGISSKEEENNEEDMEDSPLAVRRKRILKVNDSDSDDEGRSAQTTSKGKFRKKLKLDGLDSNKEENKSISADDAGTKLQKFKFEKSEESTSQNGNDPKHTFNISDKSRKVDDVATSDINTEKNGVWFHDSLDFLKQNKIRDGNRRRPDHPDYDPKTLYVPDDFLNTQTPAHRQWWIMKSKHFDSVLFFKVGKFYELYHMDAVIGANYLGFSYMKDKFAHSGFPESAYGRMANTLIENGFKVARIEQTETPEMMAERCKTKKSTKFDKVVNREICQISTKGTCVYGPQLSDARHALPSYMIAIAKRNLPNGRKRFGVTFIDTSIGIFNIAEFDDDKYCSRLLALLAQHSPGLVLTERGNMTAADLEILKKIVGNIRHDVLAPESQFYSAETTIKNLTNASYFLTDDGHLEWPSIFKELVDNGSPKAEYELALKALGACIWYLKDSELDVQVLTLKKFQIYKPLDMEPEENVQRDVMVIDSVTIENLKLLGGVGSLQNVIDHCETAFGKRLLQQWICCPLCNVEKIVERQKAVQELLNSQEMLQNARTILKKLPDLERQLTKIHIFGNKHYANNHPDSRAIFYEAQTYSKRRIFDLLETIDGFRNAQAITNIFKGCKSFTLQRLTQHPPNGAFLDISEIIEFFKNAFDQEQAKTEGKIIPQKGVDSDFDNIEKKIEELNRQLDDYLKEQQKFFGCQVTYFGTEKKRFQLEIPDHKTYKVTSEYQLEGAKKGQKPCKRYSTSTTRALLAEMLKAEARRAKILQDLNRRIFEKFSMRRDSWEQIINCLTSLDALCSLAEFARTYSEDICMPNILPFSNKPFVKIENGRYVCINVENFVPNDIQLGTEHYPAVLLLSGPNMGGKSTLMQQTAIIMILAQIGSYVPASFCEMTAVDRIFTRLGAEDDLLHGQSTFFVELSEASTILQHATVNSFVLVDELGRGTSTHDGTAVATAYVQKLVEINCRTIFSTHFHTLIDHYTSRSDVQLGHMACIVENEDNISQETVTFLYKMVAGQCPKSYGFNVARLAGLPEKSLIRAHQVAQDFERVTKNRIAFLKILFSDIKTVRSILLHTN